MAKDEIVAMDFVNSAKFIWVWLGLWSIGAKPAFINSNLTGKPLVHTIETSTARLVLVDEAAREKFSEEVLKEHGFTRVQEQKYGFEVDIDAAPRPARNHTLSPLPIEPKKANTKVQQRFQIIHFDKDIENHILAHSPTREPDSSRAGQTRSSIAMLIYTSGTTGLPKPAVMSWGKAYGGSKLMSSWLGLTNEDVVYTPMPLYHSSASVLGVCAVLHAGSAICLSTKFSHKTCWPEVVSSNATLIHYVGETCRYLLSAPPSYLDKKHKLRAAYGNGLRPDVWEPFKQRFNIPTIYEFYAATEAPGALFNRSSNTFSSGAIGRNGAVTSLLYSSGLCLIRLDITGAPIRSSSTDLCGTVDTNEPGELLFRLDPHNIPQKFQGYLNNPTANSLKVLRNVKKEGDAWYRSGDLMRHDSEGRWWWVDRVGDTFRWKAENVSTAEVAEVLGKYEHVQEACVYGVQIPHHDGRAGCAAVVLKNGKRLDEVLKGLAEHVQKELAGFAKPIWVRVTRELERTGTMKQMKNILQQEGVDPGAVERSGDLLYWLKDGMYVRFGSRDWEWLRSGRVKL